MLISIVPSDDEQNRKTGETVTYPDGHTQSYGYGYSLAGKKTRLVWADGTEINYGYSEHGELKSMTIPNEGTIQINEYGWIAPKKITLPGGTTQTKGYDGLLNLETFKVQSSAEILNLANTYGKQQELTKRSRTDTANNSSNSKTESFSYDDELRLTKVETEGWLLNDKEIFTLDAVGNRTEHNKSQNPWAYDENNRLIKIGEGNCGSANTICYDYDEAGNTTKRTEGNRQTNYHYDTNNRLIEVSSSTNGTEQLIARYGYDPMNRRLWKEQYGNKDGQAVQAKRTYFLYSDEGLIGEETQNITLNEDGSVTANGQPELTTQYGPRPDSEFTTGIMFVKTKNTSGEDTIAYYHHDHLDTPIQATDKDGNIVWSAIYNAFGRVTITTPAATADKPTITSNLRLPGQYEDSETELYYNWNRYYSPDEGRYVTNDPLGIEGGELNFYLYSENTPVNISDPTGECPWCVGAGIGAAISITKQMGICMLLGGDWLTCLKCVNWVDVAVTAVMGAIQPGLIGVAKSVAKYRTASTTFGKSAARIKMNATVQDYVIKGVAGAVVKNELPPYRIECEDECERYQLGHGVTSAITSITTF